MLASPQDIARRIGQAFAGRDAEKDDDLLLLSHSMAASLNGSSERVVPILLDELANTANIGTLADRLSPPESDVTMLWLIHLAAHNHYDFQKVSAAMTGVLHALHRRKVFLR